jgi:hypothetical protein
MRCPAGSGPQRCPWEMECRRVADGSLAMVCPEHGKYRDAMHGALTFAAQQAALGRTR